MPSTTPPSHPVPGYLLTLQRFLDLAMHTAEAASAEGNHRIVLQAIREGARIITLLLKLTSSSDQQQGRLPQAPTELLGLDRLLNTAPAIPEDQHSGISPGPSASDLQPKNRQPDHGHQPAQTCGVNLETLPTDLTRELLTGMFRPQAGPETLTLENRKWEKSGKLPGKSTATTNNSKLIQKVSRYEKNPREGTPQGVQTPVAPAG